jgi:hypothetical protein
MKRALLIACVLAGGIAAPAQGRVYQAGALSLGGTYPTCGWVPTTLADIPDIAQSTPGMIHLNPHILRLPQPLQLFWYAHECAHQLYGISEGQADCWAARRGRDQGWFREEDFAVIEWALEDNRGDAHHEPGPQRIALIRRCFTTPASQYAGPRARGPGLATYARESRRAAAASSPYEK